MNIVDYVIIGILAVSVLFGMYRGFISSVLNVAAGLISFFVSLKAYPTVANWIAGSEDIVMTLRSVTDADKLIGDMTLAGKPMYAAVNDIERVTQAVSLPEPLGSILGSNMKNAVFGPDTPVAAYVSETVLNVCIGVIAFVVTFFALYLLASVVLNLIRSVVRFPALKRLDSWVGGLFGLLRGLLVCIVLFTLVPLVETVVPIDGISQMVAESQLAGIFTTGGPIVAIMNGSLWSGG